MAKAVNDSLEVVEKAPDSNISTHNDNERE
jgi:hypothetical protein